MAFNLIQKPWWTSESIGLNNQYSAALFDGWLEPLGEEIYALHKRPGLNEEFNPGTNAAGMGCHYSEKLDTFFFVSNGKLWSSTSSGATCTLLGTGFSTTNPTIFAEGQNLDSTAIIYMAFGGKMKYTDGTTVTDIADATVSSLNVSFVHWLNGRFICNEDGSNRFYSTGYNPGISDFDNTYWSISQNPFAANIKADDLTCISSQNGELWLWGSEGVEIWQENDTYVFIPVSTACIEAPLVAPYSVTKIDNSQIALVRQNGELAVCSFTGRAPTSISASISRQLNQITTYSDARGFILFNGGASFYVLAFPTEGVTWAYDLKSQYWQRWGKWNDATATYEPYLGQFAAFARKWGKYLIQSRVDGRIYSVSRDYATDAGYTLRTEYVSGNFNFGTLNMKRMNGLNLKVKCNQTATGTFKFVLNYQDDSTFLWNNDTLISIDFAAQKNCVEPLNRLGTFRTRQFRIVLSDPALLSIDYAETEVIKLSV
jgi:hypothetical protein